MEGNCFKKRGVTLVELLIVLCIVGVLATLTMHSYLLGKKEASRYLAKSHMLKLQSIQARYWINSGAFVSLSKLPSIDTNGVVIKEVTSTASAYEFRVTLTYFGEKEQCRILIVTNTALLPRQCWLAR